MTGDKTAVALAEIRERMAECKDGFSSDPGAYIRSAGDVPRLLAAVGAVLRLAEAAIPMLEALGGCAGHDGEFRPGCDCADGLPTAWTLDPEAVRLTVLTALTGKDKAGG